MFSQFTLNFRKFGNIFLDFRILQCSVATYCRWGGNLCGVHIENFLTNHHHVMKECWKSVHICQSYYQASMGFVVII